MEQLASASHSNENKQFLGTSVDGIEAAFAKSPLTRFNKMGDYRSEKILEIDISHSYEDGKSCRFSLVNEISSLVDDAKLPEATDCFDKETILKDFMMDQEDLEFVVLNCKPDTVFLKGDQTIAEHPILL